MELEFLVATSWSRYLEVITMKASYKNSLSYVSPRIYTLTFWYVQGNHSNLNIKDNIINQEILLPMLFFNASATLIEHACALMACETLH